MDRDAMEAHLVLHDWRAHVFYRKRRGKVTYVSAGATKVLEDGRIKAACHPENGGERDSDPRVIAHFSERTWRKSGWPISDWAEVPDVAVDRIYSAIAEFDAHVVLFGKEPKRG